MSINGKECRKEKKLNIEPKVKHVDSFSVSGITVRTANRDEMDPATAKLGKHWEKFFSEGIMNKIPHRLENAPIYGVYSDYASDYNDYYNLTAGVAVSKASEKDFANINIDAGNYLVFENKGPMPQAVIDAWQAIWQYFQKNPQITRRYTTDFECYEGEDKIAVYIGIE